MSGLRTTVSAPCWVTVTVGLVAPAISQAKSLIYSFTQDPTTSQAGTPDIETVMTLATRQNQNIPAPTCNCQDAREIVIHTPPGIIGIPRALPQCNQADFGETLARSTRRWASLRASRAMRRDPMTPTTRNTQPNNAGDTTRNR